MSLTDDERDRFATWLEQDAASSEAIAEQSLKLGAHGGILAKRLRTESLAQRIVAAKLRSIQSHTLGGQP